MKVRITSSFASSAGTYEVGSTVELGEGLARRLIARGVAVPAEGPRPFAPIEAAVPLQPEIETAVKRKPRRTRKKKNVGQD